MPNRAPVIQECLHPSTETCGFNCWYFWNVGKSPALRRLKIAEARYGRVVEWQGVVNPTGTASMVEQPGSDEAEKSRTLSEAILSTEARGLQNVAFEPLDQPREVIMEEQGFDSSPQVDPANGPEGEFHGPDMEMSNHRMVSAATPDHNAEQLVELGGGTETDGIESGIERPFSREERIETEELDPQVGHLEIKTEDQCLIKVLRRMTKSGHFKA